MTDKELLLKAICGYLPYALQVRNPRLGGPDYATGIDTETGKLQVLYNGYTDDIEKFKPYLRPMSSMTKEEKKEFSKLLVKRYCEEDWEGHISTSYCIEIDNVYTDDEDGIKYPSAFSMNAIDWLNAHYFDYRGLLDKGLALPAPDGMYKTK